MAKFPIFLQYDAVDCGPTCLRMICKFYGRDFSLETLRTKSFINREGVSLHGISDAAESIGFNTIAVKVNYDTIKTDVPLPCIAHVGQRHFIVIYKITADRVYTADPGVGLIKYTKKEFLEIWESNTDQSEGGILLLLQPTESLFENKGETTNERKQGLQYLFKYLRQYKKIIFQLLIGLLGASVIQFLFPFFTQMIADVGIHQKNINFIYLILIGQLFLFLSRNFIEFIRRWLLLHLSTRINISIISDFLYKLMKLPLSYFEGKFFGDTLQRIEDHSRIERFLSTSTLNIFFSMLTFAVFSFLLAYYNITIFFVFIFFSTLYLIFILFFLKRRKIIDYKRFSVLAENQTGIHQLLSGMQEIKLNNCEKRKRWEWETIQGRLFELNIGSTKLSQYQEAGALFINELKNLIIIFLSAKAVISGQISFGMMLSIQYIIGALNSPLAEFIHFITDFQNAKMSLDRIGEIHTLDSEDHHLENKQPQDYDVIEKQYDIHLKNVSFYYEGPRSKIILDKINLTIPSGKITAIVGASGSGKTTLLKLILKFYKPYSGDILVGDLHLNDIETPYWRSRCGVVMQDGYIFNDTIENNIALSDENINVKKLENATIVANAKEFIDNLPLGLKTKLGTNGSGLSQGQKQRLLIARAVYKNPSIIFFDEATSSLDSRNERIISENLDNFFHGRTAVIIAHRLSTVKHADCIVVMDNGAIVESGTHYELVEKKGYYYNLVKNQLELSK
jgi:ATP-binding cassette, subfamily B, bacterial